MEEKNNKDLSRRNFIKVGTVTGVGAAIGLTLKGCSNDDSKSLNKELTTSPKLAEIKPLQKVKMGFVGVGHQGTNHVKNFLRIDNVEITAICDIIPEHAENVKNMVLDAGFPAPKLFTNGKSDYIKMCEEEDLDLVFTATPWEMHVPVCVAAMKNGKHAATEVPAAVTVDECWQMVETAEKFNRHCVMMENCNYGKRELTVLNMVRLGVFGEIMHTSVGYLHDLRENKLGPHYVEDWRVKHSMERNGNLYPTHGLGPVANVIGINRGDQFDHLVSMSSNSRGLQKYSKDHPDKFSKYLNTNFALGDVNISLIKTKKGITISLYHDTNLPRPYTRIDLVQGTKAISVGYPDQIYIEGVSPAHEWEPLQKYLDQYEHPLWKNIGELAKGAGHGGMDFLEDYRLIQALLTGTPTDMDVYDAAALSCVSEISEISVTNNSKPVDIPDFTRGMWKKRDPIDIPER